MKHAEIDRYKIIKRLGSGTSGSVYLAEDPKMGRKVAVKVLQADFAKSTKHRARFEREARAIATLNHPNIVDIYDFGGSPDQYLYLVMEFVPGLNLGQLAEKYSPLPEAALVAIGIELSAALSHAHDTSIIHRDLKPENVFLNQGRLVLADFGIAKAITEDSPLSTQAGTQVTEIIGTPGFMAPEQLQGRPLDGRADIFALGALLYYLATGELPYQAESPFQLLNTMRETRPSPVISKRPEFSRRFSTLIESCLSCNPAQRPESMNDIRRAFTKNLKHLGGGDARQLLAECESDPSLFHTHARLRTIEHLIGQLKIAARDHDTSYAQIVKTRLATLSLEPQESAKVKSITALLNHPPEEPPPEQLFETYRKRRTRRNLIALTGLVIALSSWWTVNGPRYFPPASPPPSPRVSTARLKVTATHPTSIFINGGTAGTTPGFQTTNLKSGVTNFEFIGPRNALLKKEVNVVPGSSLRIRIDWRKKRVSVTDQ